MKLHFAVLGTQMLIGFEFGGNFNAGNDLIVEVAGNFQNIMEDAVDSKAHQRAILFRLDVDIRGTIAKGIIN